MATKQQNNKVEQPNNKSNMKVGVFIPSSVFPLNCADSGEDAFPHLSLKNSPADTLPLSSAKKNQQNMKEAKNKGVALTNLPFGSWWGRKPSGSSGRSANCISWVCARVCVCTRARAGNNSNNVLFMVHSTVLQKSDFPKSQPTTSKPTNGIWNLWVQEWLCEKKVCRNGAEPPSWATGSVGCHCKNKTHCTVPLHATF